MSRKSLVPLILPADPAAAMEAATKQYVDGKVGGPPAGSTFVLDPARAGARSDAPNIARFGCVGVDGRVGLFAEPDGTNVVINANARGLVLYQLDAAGSGFEIYGFLGKPRSELSTWGMGPHPVHSSIQALWHKDYPGSGDYTLMTNVSTTFLNARDYLQLRINNADIIQLTGGAISPYVKTYSRYYVGASSWDTSHYVACGLPSDITNGARLSLHAESANASQLRASMHEGGLGVIDWSGTAWTTITAAAFYTGSSIETKKAVREARTIGLERERIVVRQDPRSDTVPDDLDIMALRPVAFRPKTPAGRPVKNKDGEWEGEEWPLDSWWGHEGHRERLGLVAEDVETVIPSAVSHSAEGDVSGVDYAQVTVALLAHVQRMTEEMATMRYRITELEAMVQ